jgi:RHS repeat-associated protein
MAKANPIRFSTKYQDDESDLRYYGYRYYNPSTGAWRNRDPLEEKGGKNLYVFVANGPVSQIDSDGELTLTGVEFTDSTFRCGQYSELFELSLQNTTPKAGYIVQEVDETDVIYDCEGRLVKFDVSHIWETGIQSYSPGLPNGVLPAGTPAGYGIGDTWQWMKAHPGTYGTITLHGDAKFYYAKTTGILNYGPVSGTSFGTTTQPSFWVLPPDNGESEVTHTTTISWICCCGEKKSSVVSDPRIPHF